jgi:transposase-like protein
MTSHFPNHARSPTLQVNIKNVIDDVQCSKTVRELRWPEGITCPSCQSKHVIKRGFDDKGLARQRYEWKDCHPRFDDLTDTMFAGHHQPLKVWVLCLYFMGLNVSNAQIAQELDVDLSDGQQRTTQRREGMVKKSRKKSCLMKWNVTKRMLLLAIKASLSPYRKRDEKVGGIDDKGNVAEARESKRNLPSSG